jgi:hypothetical protein
MPKAALNRKKTLFTNKLDLNLRNKLVKCYIWSIALYGAGTCDTSESRSEIRGKFYNVELYKDGEDRLNRS